MHRKYARVGKCCKRQPHVLVFKTKSNKGKSDMSCWLAWFVNDESPIMQDAWNIIDLVILSFDLTRLGSYSFTVEKNVRMMLSTRAVRIITLTPEMRSLVLALLKTMPVIASVFGLGTASAPSQLWACSSNTITNHQWTLRLHGKRRKCHSLSLKGQALPREPLC